MRARFIVWAAGIGSVALVLAAMCVVVAQNPPITRSRTAAPPSLRHGNEVAAQGAIEVRRESATFDGPGLAPPSTFPGSSGPIYPGTTTVPTPSKPAFIELRSGLKLDGQLASGPIPCQVMFGDASLPRIVSSGIRMSDELVNDEGGQARPTSATIVLENGDSLTGLPRLDVIHLQTDWGEAAVKLTHLKSLVLTSESVTWQQYEGRWRLISVEPTPADAAEDSVGPSHGGFAAPETSDAPSPIIPRASSLLPSTDAAPPNLPAPPATGEPAKNY